VGTGDSFPVIKRPGREADHSPPSGAEVKNAWSCTSTSPYVFMAWYCVKHRDNSTFTLLSRLKLHYTVQVKVKLSLCLTKCHSMKTYGGMEVQLHAFLTSAPDGGEGSASCPGRFTPGIRDPGTH
jgi:hypothetical protein